MEKLKLRFHSHVSRHASMEWSEVEKRLSQASEKVMALLAMEQTGGEPDVVDFDENSGEYVFFDCSPESPSGRRSLCYDGEALASRKENKPRHSALGMAAEMGIELMNEAQYQFLQTLGNFDAKTSSWLLTPTAVRQLGGAIFGDYRFGRVFIYHNGAESYYAARGFRGVLRV